MLLYLVQHGKAKPKEENPDRPLTAEGRREIDAVMLLMMQYGAVTATRVLHSGMLRAAETAQMIGSRLNVDAAETDGLSPMDDPSIWADRLGDEGQDTMLVGHMPHLSRLASRLLCGDPDAGLVEFSNGGIVCLASEGSEDARGGEGPAAPHWTLKWSIPPSLLR